MGYMHSWDCRIEIFPKTFLDDVKSVLLEEVDILKDLQIHTDYIRFNGKGEYGFETFVLYAKGNGSCKTGGFGVAAYDKAVTAVLLLGAYHLQDKFVIHSDGVHNFCINLETKAVNRYFEKGISYLEEKFGYKFERELRVDEYDQNYIFFLPKPSEGKEKQDVPEIIFQKIKETQEHISGQIEVVQKYIEMEGMGELLPLMKQEVEHNTELFRSYLQLL